MVEGIKVEIKAKTQGREGAKGQGNFEFFGGLELGLLLVGVPRLR